MSDLLTVSGLSRRFVDGGLLRKRKVFHAVSDVSFNLKRGQILGVVGESGCGKSTLARLVLRLISPSDGQVTFDGVDMASLSRADLRSLRQRMQLVFQDPYSAIDPRYSVRDALLEPFRVQGVKAKAPDETVASLLDMVGLNTSLAQSYPHQLSGGQKQRVGIARALATDPDILLCDEATSALDPETTRNILALIADLNRELGLTIVLITHEMEVVRQVCDRVAVLHAGRVAETGSVANVFLRPQAAETRALIDEDDQGAQPIAFDGPVVRLTLQGEAVLQPVLTRIARETGTDFAILDGRIGRLKDAGFGQLTLGLTGGDTEAALAALRRHGEVAA